MLPSNASSLGDANNVGCAFSRHGAPERYESPTYCFLEAGLGETPYLLYTLTRLSLQKRHAPVSSDKKLTWSRANSKQVLPLLCSKFWTRNRSMSRYLFLPQSSSNRSEGHCCSASCLELGVATQQENLEKRFLKDVDMMNRSSPSEVQRHLPDPCLRT